MYLLPKRPTDNFIEDPVEYAAIRQNSAIWSRMLIVDFDSYVIERCIGPTVFAIVTKPDTDNPGRVTKIRRTFKRFSIQEALSAHFPNGIKPPNELDLATWNENLLLVDQSKVQFTETELLTAVFDLVQKTFTIKADKLSGRWYGSATIKLDIDDGE